MLAPASAAAQSPITPVLDGSLTLNLQAPMPAIDVPLHFQGGNPDNWTARVSTNLPVGTGDFTPEQDIARASGTGAVRNPSLLLIDRNWRWNFLNSADMQVYLVVTWRSAGLEHVWMPPGDLPWLRMYTNRGLYDGGTGLPGRFGIYTGLGSVIATPEPYYAALGRLAHDTTSPATFAKGRRSLRSTAVVPYAVRAAGTVALRATVEYVPRRRPRHSTVVYKGTRAIAATAQAGTRADVRTRLTRAGGRLARRLGAKKLAKALASSGRVWFISTSPNNDNPIERLAVPLGTCFADDQLDHGYPCRQTCPPFPNMPTGYVIYAELGVVYGSPTCTRGAPLEPWPAS
jgi:hypothetical protein